MHVTVWRQPSPRTAWTVSHLHAVSDFITHVVYVHVLKRYKREVRIYGDHCTVVVVRLEQRKSAFCKSGFGRKRVSSPTVVVVVLVVVVEVVVVVVVVVV